MKHILIIDHLIIIDLFTSLTLTNYTQFPLDTTVNKTTPYLAIFSCTKSMHFLTFFFLPHNDKLPTFSMQILHLHIFHMHIFSHAHMTCIQLLRCTNNNFVLLFLHKIKYISLDNAKICFPKHKWI